MSLDSRAEEINLVPDIEEDRGQLPDGNIAERGVEDPALTLVGVSISPQESLSDLQEATATVDADSHQSDGLRKYRG